MHSAHSPARPDAASLLHPRTVGWFGTTAVAMGGINQSLFLLSALFIGQGTILGQGSAAVVLLFVGLLLSWMATPGWTELILMYPNRVGGIAATCAEAFRPYSPVLANLTGVCYWWGWVPTCGLTALLASSAMNHWYMPWFPVPLMASCLVLFFTFISLCGVKWIMRLAMPVATASAVLAFLSAVVPIFSGSVDWQQAFTFHLTVPFDGWFGQVTSVMAGLYLIGFAAPAFEQAACHVGETIDPNKNVPRAMFASAGLATLYFVVLPIVWLGALGPESMGKELALVLGPTFAPLLGGAAKATAIWFMIFNMLHGTIAALAGASRTLAQLSEDGLLPEFLSKRSRTDAPWTATLLTAGMAILFLLIGDPVWLIAAANLTYLIGISMPSIAVWLLRRNEPQMVRPYRAPRGTILLGLFAAGAWALTAIFGFEQFGLPTVLIGIVFAYSGSALYAWRKFADRRKAGLPGIARTLHLKLTGAMLLVLVLDAAGYLIAVGHVPTHHTALISALQDIFVVVALLTISVGLILPGMIAHSAVEVSKAAEKLVKGTLADFTRAMRALAAGDLDAAKARFVFEPVIAHTRDEVGDMAESFNRLQEEVGRATGGLEGARAGLSEARAALTDTNERLRLELAERKFAEEELKRARDEHALILESLAEGVYGIGLDGRINFRNPAAARLLGYETLELIGLPAFETIRHSGADGTPYSIERCPIYATMCDGEARRGTNEFFWRKDGVRFPVEFTSTAMRDELGDIIGAVVVFTDITERKRLEKEFLRAQRMESIGTLAGGIAHDLNNVLAPILTSVELLRLNCAPEDLELLDVLQNSAERGANMLKQVLWFARGAEGLHVDISPAQLVNEMLKLARDTFPKSIEIETAFADGVREVSAEPTQVHQVLLNFCVNARDAMPDGGKLTINAENVEVSEEQASEHPNAKPGAYVAISVTDTGTGIPREVCDRMFEPFFTTKEIGKGTGLGLSTALGIINSHQGFLTVKSKLGRGSTFTVFLPALESGTASQATAAPVALPRSDGELILVVDDEAAIRRISQRTLEAAGYRVVTAGSGVEAAALFKTRRSEFAAVLTDVMMPGMDGLALARALRCDMPDVKIVATSGMFGADLETEHPGLVEAFLPKPFTAATLLRTMKEALEKAAA